MWGRRGITGGEGGTVGTNKKNKSEWAGQAAKQEDGSGMDCTDTESWGRMKGNWDQGTWRSLSPLSPPGHLSLIYIYYTYKHT